MPPIKITVAEIIVAINENIDATSCRGEKNCHADQTCLTHQLWEDLSTRIHEFLNGITLADLVSKPHVQQVASRQEGRIPVTIVR
jgi:Rrf2 family iron-sulfur cluster assembly transcriptional regulator